jgi:hypothetical protein
MGWRSGGIIHGMSAAPSDLDLSVLPPEYRAAFEAQQDEEDQKTAWEAVFPTSDCRPEFGQFRPGGIEPAS